MILVDTSVWADHFRVTEPNLVRILASGDVVMHPFVVGELALGTLKNRIVILSLLHDLPEAPLVSDKEALYFLEKHRLTGRGIGYIDLHLLASVALTGRGKIWTKDKRLSHVAETIRLAVG